MKIADFNVKPTSMLSHTISIVLDNGEDTGETITLVGPETNAAVKASREFILAYRGIEYALEELKEKCSKLGKEGDFTEYNFAKQDRLEVINRAMAVGLVESWSLEDECVPANVEALMQAHGSLVSAIVSAHAEAKAKLTEK